MNSGSGYQHHVENLWNPRTSDKLSVAEQEQQLATACGELVASKLVDLRNLWNPEKRKEWLQDTKFPENGIFESVANAFEKEAKGVRLVGGEFYNIVDLAVCNLRKTLSVRVAAAEVYRQKKSAVVKRAGDDAADSNRGDGDARYLVASGVVLLLGPVLRGLVCPGLDLSTVEERPRGPRDSFDCDMPLEKFREWCFPLHAHWACSSDETHDGSRGWPVFNICKQKNVRTQFMHTQKLSLFLEGANTRRSDVRKDQREEEDTRRAIQCAAHGAAWAKKFLTKRHRVIARNP